MCYINKLWLDLHNCCKAWCLHIVYRSHCLMWTSRCVTTCEGSEPRESQGTAAVWCAGILKVATKRKYVYVYQLWASWGCWRMISSLATSVLAELAATVNLNRMSILLIYWVIDEHQLHLLVYRWWTSNLGKEKDLKNELRHAASCSSGGTQKTADSEWKRLRQNGLIDPTILWGKTCFWFTKWEHDRMRAWLCDMLCKT